MIKWIPIADAKIEVGKRYEVTTGAGFVDVMIGSQINNRLTLAVREYNPEPYVPPKPKRRVLATVDGAFLLERLPGDPDPDRVIEAIAEMRKYQTGDMNFWADKLEGKNE